MRNFLTVPVLREKGVDGRLTIPARNEDNPKEFRNFLDMMAFFPQQVHSSKVVEVGRKRIYPRPEADALVTFEPMLPIGVLTADCVPILVYAPDVKGVAAIHAGWRGTLGGIVDNTVDLLKSKGASCGNMEVVFGPSISALHYEVGEELANRFVEAGFADYVSYPGGEGSKPHLDLQGINIERLRRRGVPLSRIVLSEDSTFDARDEEGYYLYPSYRRDNATEMRFMTSIMLDRWKG